MPDTLPYGVKEVLKPRQVSFTDDDFHDFRDLIRDKSGIYYSDKKRSDLQTGVLKAFQFSDCSSLHTYYNLLKEQDGSSNLFKTLVSYLTVGETYFFRHINVIKKEILPKLIEKNQHSRRLNIWSAGCATGEEPYTIAILLHEILPDLQNWNIRILATDININYLKYAQEGLYRLWSLRVTDEYFKSKYFEKEGDLFRLREDIRDMVDFKFLNLVEADYPSDKDSIKNFNFVLCRNVTIYFQMETTSKVISKFYDTLLNQSYLAVGHSEPSSLIYDAFVSEIYPEAVVYRKDKKARELLQHTGIRTRDSMFHTHNESMKKDLTRQINTNLSNLQQSISKLNQEKVSQPAKEPVKPRRAIKKPKTDKGVRKKTEKQSQSEQEKILAERRRISEEAQLFNTALTCFRSNDLPKSREHFEKLISRNKDNSRAHYMLGHIYANLDEIEKAKNYCNLAIELNPLLLEAYYLLGLIHREEQMIDDSINMLKKTIYLDMEFALGYYELAVNYFKRSDILIARKFLNRALKILAKKEDGEQVGILDDLTVRELKLMVSMWN